MNTDFRIEVGFFDHHKTRRLIAALGTDAAWALLRLWEFAAVNKPDGSLSGMTDEDIAAAAHYPGEPARFLGELRRLRWLDKGRRSTLLHDWKEHQPFVINAPHRKEAGRKAAEARWKAHKEADAERMRVASKNDAEGNAPPKPSSLPSSGSSSGSSSLPPESVPVPGGSPAASRKRAAPVCPFGAAFQAFAEAAWQERHGAKPPWGREHGVALRMVAPQLGTLDASKAAWSRFLDCREPWAIDHDPKVFKQRIGRFVGTPPQAESRFTKPTPGSCRNCRSDLAPGLEFCNGDCRRIYEKARTA